MQAIISPNNTFGIWAVLILGSALCMYGERKGWFGKLSGALIVIILMGLLVTAGLIPSASDPEVSVSVYGFVFSYVIPTAIPLLLFNANLKRIIRESGRLLGIYLIGSIGVAIGAVVAHTLIPLGEEGYKVAGTFTGTYTGGSVNFMAVAKSFDFLESPLFAATIAVDNVFTNLYITFLFFMPAMTWLMRWIPFGVAPEATETAAMATADTGSKLSLMEEVMQVFAIAAAVCAVGYFLAPLLQSWWQTDIHLEILVVTVLIIAVANLFPQAMQRLEKTAYEMGMLLMYVFLAVIGAASDLREMVQSSPGIIAFASIVLLVHLLITMIAGRLFKISLREIAIASCANAGGPPVAASMAATFGMKRAVTPAILIGILGYVIGSFLGVGVGLFLQ
ncbi:MAG: DUF819 family protein [Saprospiraceae bacterium]|jgi:uncharacterized membrane protein|nr:DUF819 family protein [Saprospiraceae bacterium]MDP4819647.1 DUF819 family protein [Saprospiraceae bacterium]